jgi:hypothetical protein
MKKKLIKAKELQRSSWFLDLVNDGQRKYQEFFKDAHLNTKSSDSEILRVYITRHDIAIGIFKDAEYELGWGFYVIKGQPTSMRIVQSGVAEQVSLVVIPCRELEEAVAMSQVYGDIKRSN